MENPIKMDDLEVPLFSETSIYTYMSRLNLSFVTYIYAHSILHGVFFDVLCLDVMYNWIVCVQWAKSQMSH